MVRFISSFLASLLAGFFGYGLNTFIHKPILTYSVDCATEYVNVSFTNVGISKVNEAEFKLDFKFPADYEINFNSKYWDNDIDSLMYTLESTSMSFHDNGANGEFNYDEELKFQLIPDSIVIINNINVPSYRFIKYRDALVIRDNYNSIEKNLPFAVIIFFVVILTLSIYIMKGGRQTPD